MTDGKIVGFAYLPTFPESNPEPGKTVRFGYLEDFPESNPETQESDLAATENTRVCDKCEFELRRQPQTSRPKSTLVTYISHQKIQLQTEMSST